MLSLHIERKKLKEFRTIEAIKAFRTNVQFCGADVRVICMTSCQAAEGKSTISIELAIALAEAGKKVLFIDADLRLSNIAGRYSITQKTAGLSQYLSGMNTIEEVLYATDIPKFHMILAGPQAPNPAELLGGKLFADSLKSLRSIYDYIIIDTPPVGEVIDAAVVATNCDGAIMVMYSGRDNLKFAKNVIKQLEKSGCRILGSVLNGIKVSNQRGYYKDYGYGYGYGYGHSRDDEEDK